jgi:hypothetical protein
MDEACAKLETSNVNGSPIEMRSSQLAAGRSTTGTQHRAHRYHGANEGETGELDCVSAWGRLQYAVADARSS